MQHQVKNIDGPDKFTRDQHLELFQQVWLRREGSQAQCQAYYDQQWQRDFFQ